MPSQISKTNTSIIISSIIIFGILFLIHIQKEVPTNTLSAGLNNKFHISLKNAINQQLSVASDNKIDVIIEVTEPEKFITDNGLVQAKKLKNYNLISDKLTIQKILELSQDQNSKMFYADTGAIGALEESIYVINANPENQINRNLGIGTKICILDSGIINHPYLSYVPLTNQKGFTYEHTTIDGLGHGTHIAGIINADYYRTTNIINNFKGVGIAPGATLYIAKVLDNNNFASWLDVMEGFDWCVNEVKADVLSISLQGEPYPNCDDYFVCKILNNVNAGVVVAAGNTGSEVQMPGCCSNVITVGAVNKQDIIWQKSSKGSEIDILAVGDSVQSTYLPTTLYPQGSIRSLTGTSMATPMVSSAYAILKQAKPSATKQEITSALYLTAMDLGYSEEVQGNGLLDTKSACVALAGQNRCEELFDIIDINQTPLICSSENCEMPTSKNYSDCFIIIGTIIIITLLSLHLRKKI